MKQVGAKIPKLGMRTVKTAICVAVCLLISRLYSDGFTLYSSIAAIVCMQSTIENTIRTGLYRLMGTLIGGGFGMLLLFFTTNSIYDFMYLIIMPVGIIVVIYFCNMVKMPGSSTIGAIVLISVFVSPLQSSITDNVYILALFRMLDTAVGIFVAMFINRFIAPARMRDPKEVHLSCETYEDVYARVKDRLMGNELLILYDPALTASGSASKKPSVSAPDETYVRISVPVEYAARNYIPLAYVSSDFTVRPMNIKQDCGYIDIPGSTFPCTVVWQVEKPELLP